jgi:hypothetical protein
MNTNDALPRCPLLGCKITARPSAIYPSRYVFNNLKMIEIGKIGKISAGDNKGWQLKVINDEKNTGGYLVVISRDFSNPQAEAYDDWVDSLESLKQYFEESKWVVEW